MYIYDTNTAYFFICRSGFTAEICINVTKHLDHLQASNKSFNQSLERD